MRNGEFSLQHIHMIRPREGIEHSLTLLGRESDRDTVRCSPSFGPKFSLIKVDRCLQNIIDRSLLLGLWEL